MQAPKIRFTAAGDMLVQRRIPIGYQGFEEVRQFISQGDACFFNLETTLHHGQFCGNQFYGGSFLYADPGVLDDARAFGFNMLSFANNHAMDFSYGGLLQTLKTVREKGFVNAGVGNNLDEAAAPAYLDTPIGRVALIAAVSSMMNPAAMAGRQSRRMPGRPGVNGLRIDEKIVVTPQELSVIREIAKKSCVNAKDDISRAEGYQPPLPENETVLKELRFIEGEETRYLTSPNKEDVARVERAIYEAQMQADYIIISIHAHELSGSKKENPGDFLVEFAHKCIDAGAHAVIGHGPHLLRPVEIYKQRPIFYSLGDFVLHNENIQSAPEEMFQKYGLSSDDTLRDVFRTRSNNYTRGLLSDRLMLESVIPCFEMEDGVLKSLVLMPIELGFGQPRWRSGNPRFCTDKGIIERLGELSAPYGTVIRVDSNGFGVVEL